MKLTSIFQHKSHKEKIILFALISFVSIILGSIITVVSLNLFFSIDLLSLKDVLEDSNKVFVLKVHILINFLFNFIFPSLIFLILVSSNFKKYLGLNHAINYQIIMIVISIMLMIIPLSAFMSQINSSIISMLPEYFDQIVSWMKTKETEAENMTIALLKMEKITDLFFNLFLIAVIPAVGEELFFRGVLQKLFIDWTSKKHFSILLTAFLFSAIHMQFFGFFPRFMLGALLGYLFYYSGNLWIPIIAHFFNNALIIIVSYPSVKKSLNTNILSENTEVAIHQALISFFAVIILFYLFYKISEFKKETH